MNYNKLVEEIARRIYWYDGGMSPEDYAEVFDKAKPGWAKVHDFQKEENCLAEHERDDYRTQATHVIDYLLRNDLLDVCKSEVFSESTH